MFSSLSLPTILSSTRPRRFITYTTATLGTAYIAGKWALGRVLEGAERGRREGWGREDLARRFNLNIQDSQFTVLALLPTLSQAVVGEMDVEGLTGELGERARREREERVRAEEERRRREEEEDERARAKAAEEEVAKQSLPNGDANEMHGTTSISAPLTSTTSLGQPLHSPLLPMLNNHAPALNPSAPVFHPRSPSPPHPTEAAEVEPSTVSLAQREQEGGEMGASWAEVVKRDVPEHAEVAEEKEKREERTEEQAVANGDAQKEEKREDKGYEVDGSAEAEGEKVEVNGVGDDHTLEEKQELATEQEDAKPAVPEKSKAELWNSIKLLSFTRLFTSIYLLVLLSLQTHVQLALLGRSAYIESLLSTLPPRSPSPSSSARLLPESPSNPPPALADDAAQDDDLESALYAAKSLPPTPAEARKDLERKYLTFSWWLLHEGWKVVWRRVEGAVEEVVGPMGLKTPLVYGELGALFAQIRRRIEQDADGKLFDFSPALHPPTQDLEIQTLIAGGSYTPPSSSSPTHLSADPITPSLRSLLNETSDALDSSDAALVRALSLDKLFSLALEKVEVAFRSSGGERGARFEDVTEKQARLASLLPVLTRLSAAKGDAQGAVLASGVNGNEWVEALEDVRELREFAAVLYGSWDRDNFRASCVL
ncbi:Microbody Peroxisome biogenesis protein peroxin 3 [Rhodotorula toruloides ATCC 204091]|uniref:Microbody peroxisome biogenesis protein peroxin 3 n=1 Tax=Rhodotorula toruloides TaxID=5286 RepID=A0A0K3CRI0_RHOTO|nr:Microbody Peroxisome biogenesis protein peroxin 3 [Rhodotorula toruloides ATCC 204091]PRQ69901.1 microbody peroxisome biogenesis protein peroxin 3 [Rhodotorula toruloides]